MKKFCLVTVIFLSFMSLAHLIGPCGAHGDDHGSHLHAALAGPASLMPFHLHPEGSFMTSVRYLYQDMKDHHGHVAGADDDHESTGDGEDEHEEHDMHSAYGNDPNGRHDGHEHEPDAPALAHKHSMSMQMFMLDAMYGVTNSVTLMGMVPFHLMEMEHHLGDMRQTTRSEGIGDISLSGLFGIGGTTQGGWILAAGLSFPTGDIDDTDNYHADTRKHPYHMKLGSGTFDALPGLSYSGHSGALTYGGQLSGVVRFGTNQEGYRLGNRGRIDAWGGYGLHENVALTARLSAEAWEDVHGEEENQPVTSSFFDPQEQAGSVLDAGLGVALIGSGALRGQRLGVEFYAPLAQSVDEGVHETRWGFAASWSAVF